VDVSSIQTDMIEYTRWQDEISRLLKWS
jgi:hypothetical protein